MRWWKPSDEWRTDTPSKRDSSKRPSMIFNEQGSHNNGSIQNDHSKKPRPDIKKTKVRSTLTCHAKTDNVVLPNGSREWMGEKWPGIPRTTHQETSPSLLTSTAKDLLPPLKYISQIMVMIHSLQYGHAFERAFLWQ